MIEVNTCAHAATFTRSAALVDENNPLTEAALSIPAGKYAFAYDYPFSRVVLIAHDLTEATNVIDILEMARADYEAIYALEDDEVGETGNIPGMLNRDVSDGPIGIWGHHLSDLYFDGVSICPKRREVYFNMGS